MMLQTKSDNKFTVIYFCKWISFVLKNEYSNFVKSMIYGSYLNMI